MKILIGLIFAASAWGQIPLGGITGSTGSSNPITLVQQHGDSAAGNCNTAGAGATTQTCTFSSAPTTGDTVLATCSTYNTTCAITDNAGTDTYTAVTGTGITSGCIISADTHKSICMYYSVNVHGSATIKATVAATSYIILHIYEVSHLSTGLDVSASHTQDTGSTSPITIGPTGSTSTADEFVLGAYGSETPYIASASAGYTLGQTDTATGTTVVTLTDMYKIISATGAQTCSMAINTSIDYTGICATFK